MVIKKRYAAILIAIVLFVIFGLCFASATVEVNSALLKLSLKQGDTGSQPFSLLSSEPNIVNLAVKNVPGVTLSDESFFMNPGETKSVDLRFNSSGLDTGVYVGNVLIKGKDSSSVLPVVLEVESKDVFFDANLDIPPFYSEVAPGNQVLAQIKMFDLTSGGTSKGLGPASVNINYKVFREDGALISSETETLVINQDSGITKSVTIPSDAKEGIYVMVVELVYGTSVGISSEMFTVSRSAAAINGFTLGNLSFSWFTVVVAIFGIILLFIYFFFLLVRDRDKFMVALKAYHDSEMEKQKEFLMDQKCVLEEKKCISPRKLNAEINQKISALRHKQKSRVRELREMRKEGDVSAMEAKLAEWKRKGYNTLLLESKLNGLTAVDIEKIMLKWKKTGYKIH